MSQKLSEIQITIKGQTFTCPRLSNENSLYFGSLLMNRDELRVFIEEEQPELAMEMMQARLIESSEQMSKLFAQKDLSSEAIAEQINNEQVHAIVQRFIVRVNQNQVPGDYIPNVRYQVAKRLIEVFPQFESNGWVTATSINMDLEDLITALAIPLFGTMASAAETQAEAKKPKSEKPKPEKPKGFKAEVQKATKGSEAQGSDPNVGDKEERFDELLASRNELQARFDSLQAQLAGSAAIDVTVVEDDARKGRILNLQKELAALGAPVEANQ